MAAQRVKTRYPSIYRQGQSWQQVIYLDGKQKWLTARTHAELKVKAQKVLADGVLGLHVPPRQVVTVTGVVDDWLRAIESSVRPTTLRGYRSNAVKVKMALGSLPVRKLTADTLTRLYNEVVEKGLTRYSAVAMHAVIRDSLSHAVRNKLVATNVAVDAKLPRRQQHDMVTLDRETAAQLLDAARDTWIYHVVALTLRTGLRRSEVLGLQWRDIDLDAAELYVHRGLHVVQRQILLEQPKSTSSRRPVALSPSACVSLRAHKASMESLAAELSGELRPDHHVFVRPDFTPMRPDSVSHLFNKIVKRAGLTGLHFHSLRHSFATLMLGAGVHPKVVADALGHSDIRVTLNLYSHPGADLQRKAAYALDAALEPASEEPVVEVLT